MALDEHDSPTGLDSPTALACRPAVATIGDGLDRHDPRASPIPQWVHRFWPKSRDGCCINSFRKPTEDGPNRLGESTAQFFSHRKVIVRGGAGTTTAIVFRAFKCGSSDRSPLTYSPAGGESTSFKHHGQAGSPGRRAQAGSSKFGFVRCSRPQRSTARKQGDGQASA